MKKAVFILLSFCFAWTLSAQQVNEKTARTVAENFYAQRQLKKSGSGLSLYSVCKDEGLQKSAGRTYYYIFRDGGNGFVIVSGDQRITPILAYSTSDRFDTTGMPDNLQWWLNSYKEQIDYTLNAYNAEQISAHALWELYEEGTVTEIKGTSGVSPLVETHWNQTHPFNLLCPYDSYQQTRCPTGCVATAMAQILKFWNYPKKGVGSHTYSHSQYGNLSADFGNTTYDWKNMPNYCTNGSSTTAQTAVATLMYHCGVSVDMDYTPTSSGAVTLMPDVLVDYYEFCDARTALMRYFGCDTVIGLYREDYYDTTNASTLSTWTNLLKNELNEGRPILYAGTGSAGGHAFVCDGYDANGNFHINWGWGGTSDGYFAITALNPDALGTGGGNGGFNYNQRALFVTAYADTTSYDLRLASALRINKDTIATDSTLRITAKIANSGKNTYVGTFGLALYTAAGELVEYIDETSQRTLSAGTSAELSFSSLNSGLYQSGKYYAVIYYKVSNRWRAVADGNYTNRIPFFLLGNGNFKLDLYGALHISANPVTYNTPFRFSDSLANFGKESFNGLVAIAIYEATSNECLTIAGTRQINLGPNYYSNLTFEIAALPGMTNGKYYGAIVYSVNNGNTWNIVNGQRHPNNVNFTVTGGPELKLYSKLNISKSTVPENSPFQIHVNIANMGAGTFNGSYAMLIFNDRGDELIAPMEIKTNRQLASNYYDSVIFSTVGMEELEKGKTYNAVVYYQLKGDSMWNRVGDFKSYSNVVSFKVGEPENQTYELKLYSQLIINKKTVVAGEGFTIAVAIANFGKKTYSGELAMGIFDSQGEYICLMDSKNEELEGGYYDSIVFSTKGMKNLTRGLYYAAALYLDENDGKYHLIADGNYKNLLSFNVTGNLDVNECSNMTCAPYPNPTSDKVFLELKESCRVDVLDADGRLLDRQQLETGKNAVNLESYSNGIYLISVQNKEGLRSTFRLIKK